MKTLQEKPCLEPCPIERGMRMIGGKWKGSLLWHLSEGPQRFNELSRQMPGASRKMLSVRLREMEEAGLLTRHVLQERPVAVEYRITEFGGSALNVLKQLKDWTESNGI